MLTLSEIKGVGDATIKKLRELDIKSVFELFSFLPTKYIDMQSPIRVSDGEEGALNLFEGRVEKVSAVSPRGKRAFSVTFSDCLSIDNGFLFKATFYNMPFLQQNFEVGDEYRIFGRLTKNKRNYEIANPKLEKREKVSKLKDVYTVYPLKGIMGQSAFKNIVLAALNEIKTEEFEGRLAKVNADTIDLFCRLHSPKDVCEAENARRSLASLDLAITLAIYRKMRRNEKNNRKVFYNFNNFRILDYAYTLSFLPTPSQNKAFCDIFNDMSSSKYLSRIVSGDVGSGKTAVAFFAAVACAAGGGQCAIMAPTEILAKQHAESFKQIAEKLNVSYVLLTSSSSAKDKREVLSGLASGEISCVIGTQSLISDGVKYKNLTLAVVDEQHKFGVNERRLLESKGAVDVLSMTATPIPRSMALTFYEDIAISVIEKREDAKTNVQTSIVPTIEDGLKRIITECKAGKQAFIVCPSIVDSEGYDVISIESFIRDYGRYFDGISVKVLHGKMKSDEKASAMQSFADGKISVLIATTVVEVGVDTRASEILVLGADRFGLASLHQLRGRVGRDGSPAHCYVHAGGASDKAITRLSVFCAHNDGQYLAEADFAARGAGDFIGTRQSGASLTPIFGLTTTSEALKAAKDYADKNLMHLTLAELTALTRRSKQRVDAFLGEIDKVTLNS